mmetsp:Transcript_7847/g.23701  ORF Transcript_7847/g.23701 Transcript_7847/m.23701 type:complete len:80 (+) Transcript_7847:814-1053(+)
MGAQRAGEKIDSSCSLMEAVERFLCTGTDDTDPMIERCAGKKLSREPPLARHVQVRLAHPPNFSTWQTKQGLTSCPESS